MRKWIETTGRSEEDAIAAALFQLELDRDSVSVEVIERAKPGFLGFGGNPARVRVSYGPDDGAEEQQSAATQESHAIPREQSQPARQAQVQPQPQSEGGDAGLQDDARAVRAVEFLTGLMTHMGLDAVPTISVNPAGGYHVVLQGQNLGVAIGRRGETLDAIQQLTNYAVNRGQSKRVRIQVDAEGYRAKREEALQRLAERVAGKAVRYRRDVTLEPMNAYERHVIHSALQDTPDVTTFSTGVEPNRRIVVSYAPDGRR